MARIKVQAWIRDEAGNKLGGTGYEVRFYLKGTTTLATLYPSDTSANTLANPLYPNAGPQTTLTTQTAAGDNALTVKDTTGFQAGNTIWLDDGTQRKELVVLSVVGPSTLNIDGTVGAVFTTTLTRVNGREAIGHVAAYVDKSVDIEMTVKTLATGIEGPREVFLVAPTNDIALLYDSGFLGAAQASIDVQNLPSTGYSTLLCKYDMRDDTAGASNAYLLGRFNNDSAANYDSEDQPTSGTATAAPAEQLAGTSARVGMILNGAAAANLFAHGEFEIPNYLSSNSQKGGFGRASSKFGTATGQIQGRQHWFNWRSTAAINRITVLPPAGNIAAGSRLQIFGYKG